MTTSATVTDPDDQACPGCGMGWASTTVNPQPYLDRLTAAVERLTAARCLSRRLHALAEEAPMITNEELRDRLLALADRARALPDPRVGRHEETTPEMNGFSSGSS